MLADLGPGLGVSIGPTPALGLVTGLHVPGAVGIVRPRPALGVVPGVAQWVEQPFMARWGDVERPPAGQLDAGGDRMDVRRPVVVAVQHRAGGVLVGLQAGKRRGLPLLEDLSDLVGGGLVLGRPRDDPAGVAPLVRAAVGDLGNHAGVAAQHRDLGSRLVFVVVAAQQVAHGAGGAALAVLQELDMHSTSSPWSSGSYRGSSASRCSSRWIAASSASR